MKRILIPMLALCASAALAADVVETTTTTTTTTSAGTITEFTPASQTLVIQTETGEAPLRYAVTKETTFVDEAGAPVTVERLTAGIPVAVHFTRAGDQLVASRIIVRKAVVVPEASTTTRTTTTEERTLTHEEKEKLEKAQKEERERAEKQRKEEKRLREEGK